MIKILFLVLFSLKAFGDDFSIRLDSKSVGVNDVFNLYFTIQAESSGTPNINFETSDNLKILGKRTQGYSTKTIYSQGKLSVKREQTIAYELQANQQGLAKIYDIRVETESGQKKHNDIIITVLKEKVGPQLVHLVAEVDKNELYVGEGVTVKYYLYIKPQVILSAFDIVKFPQLNGFMKRFLQEQERPMQASYQGEIYKKSLVYSARVYAEAIGNPIVDSMEVSVTYSEGAGGIYGNFFGRQRGGGTQKRNILSDEIKFKVNPLPLIGKPKNFSGLVGKHEVELKADARNILVNDPYKIKFFIRGDGALEKLETPRFFESNFLELFDNKADFKIENSNNAQKEFDITYLASRPGEIKESIYQFSYFDPEIKKFQMIDLKIPEIKIGGVANRPIEKETSKNERPLMSNEEEIIPSTDSDSLVLLGPNLKSLKLKPKHLTLILFSLISGLFLILVFLNLKQEKNEDDFSRSKRNLMKGQGNYKDILLVIHQIDQHRSKNVSLALENLRLKEETKNYFKDIVDEYSKQDYSIESISLGKKIDLKKVKELFKATHENS